MSPLGAAQQCKVHPREIHLLRSLLQETNYLNRVNITYGPNNDSPAVFMDGTQGIFIDNASLAFQRHLHKFSCSRKEFVIRVCVKFNQVAEGPILFLHSKDMTYLSLEITSVDGGSIKVGFVHNGGMRAVSFPYTFTDLTSWHNISVIFNGRLVSLYIDCNQVGNKVIMEPNYCLPKGVLLNIGDNPQHTGAFKVHTQSFGDVTSVM